MYSEYYAHRRYIHTESLQTKHFEPLQYLIAGGAEADILTRYLTNLLRGRGGAIDETLSFDHPTGTALHYVGASRLVAKGHMFPPVDVMVALSNSSLDFEHQVIENGILLIDKSRVDALPKRADLERLVVPSWQITRDIAEGTSRMEESGTRPSLETAAIFGVILSLHSPYFDQREARRVLEGSGPAVLPLVRAVARGYDWAQEEKHIKGLFLLGNPID